MVVERARTSAFDPKRTFRYKQTVEWPRRRQVRNCRSAISEGAAVSPILSQHFPALVLHIGGGTLGLLSGAIALSVRKGSPLHRVSGTVFFVSMLIMGAMAAYLAYFERRYSMVLGGTLAF